MYDIFMYYVLNFMQFLLHTMLFYLTDNKQLGKEKNKHAKHPSNHV